MKLTEIEQFWPILEAIRAGKTIQTKPPGGDIWMDVEEAGVMFSLSPDKYRIKPEKKKARKEEITFFSNSNVAVWGVPKICWKLYRNHKQIGSPLTLYIDVETNQFINPANLGEYDVQE